MTVFCRVRQKFFPLVDSKLYSWEDSEQKDLLMSILMTTCDIATITKPWHIQRKVCNSTWRLRLFLRVDLLVGATFASYYYWL